MSLFVSNREFLGRKAGRELWTLKAYRGLAAGLSLGLSLLLVPDASAQRTPLKPGWNHFSPQEDITLGKRAATDAEMHLQLCNAPRVDA